MAVETNKKRSGKPRRFIDPSFKDKIRKRDNYECRICFKNSSETNTQLEVHHIRPVSIGGRDRENNLITLCRECHIYVHTDIDSWVKPLREYIQLYKNTGFRYSVEKERQ